jgi:hypothetical protein
MGKRLYYSLFIVTPLLIALMAYAGCYLYLGGDPQTVAAQQTVFPEKWRRFPDKQTAWVFVPAARLESLITGVPVKASYLHWTFSNGIRRYRAHESALGQETMMTVTSNPPSSASSSP